MNSSERKTPESLQRGRSRSTLGSSLEHINLSVQSAVAPLLRTTILVKIPGVSWPNLYTRSSA